MTTTITLTPRIVWHEKDLAKRFDRAVLGGLRAAAETIVIAVKERINRIGHAPPRKKGTKSSGKTRSLYKRLALGEDILRRRSLINRFKIETSAGGFLRLANLRAHSRAVDRSRRGLDAVELALKVRRLGGLVDPPEGSPRRRSGDLFRSIGAEQNGPDSVVIGSTVPYAAIHEYGGVVNVSPFGKGPKRAIFIPARPYFRPTADEKRAEAAQAFERIFEELMRK